MGGFKKKKGREKKHRKHKIKGIITTKLYISI